MAERKLKALLDAAVGASAVGLLGAVKRFDRRRTADFAGAAMRKIGPLFKEHRLARQNLRAAFPEKSDAEIEQILAGVWDNLGRIAVEFAHLDEFCVEGVGRQTPDVITYAPEATERYRRIAGPRQADARLCRSSRQLGTSRRRGESARRAFRRALSAAEYPAQSATSSSSCVRR